jgi:hypothetical protein
MSEITLHKLQAEQTKLAAMIAAYAVQAAKTISVDAIDIELSDGEHYAGAALGADGSVTHHLVLMAEKPASRLDWQAAMDWAASVGGVLPTRQEQALLFANCKPYLEADWHWSSQTHETDASYAWLCGFASGNQTSSVKSYAGCARAVRRLTVV